MGPAACDGGGGEGGGEQASGQQNKLWNFHRYWLAST